MKKLLLVLLMSPIFGFGQCDSVKYESSYNPEKDYGYILGDEGININVYKTFGKSSPTRYSMMIPVVGKSGFNPNSSEIILTLSNKTTIKGRDFSLVKSIGHKKLKQLNDGDEYNGGFEVKEEDVIKMANYPVVKFKMGGVQYIVSEEDQKKQSNVFRCIVKYNMSNYKYKSKSVFDCNAVKIEHDDMEDKSSTKIDRPGRPIKLNKLRVGEYVSYSLMIATTSKRRYDFYEKGVILLLEDGERVSFPEADVEFSYISSDYYMVSTFLRLNTEEIEKIIKNPIKKYRLYVLDYEVSDSDKQFQQESFRCVLDADLFIKK